MAPPCTFHKHVIVSNYIHYQIKRCVYSVRVVPSKQHTAAHVVITLLENIAFSKKHQLQALANNFNWFGNRDLISLLAITLNYVVSVRKGFFLLVVVEWAALFYCGNTKFVIF